MKLPTSLFFGFALILGSSTFAAEPLISKATLLEAKSTINSPLKSLSLEQQVANLAAMVAEQQSRISKLEQQVQAHGIELEMQASDNVALNQHVNSMQQVFSIDDGTLSIDAEVLQINTLETLVQSPIIRLEGDIKVEGELEAETVKAEYIHGECYAPGSGNIW